MVDFMSNDEMSVSANVPATAKGIPQRVVPTSIAPTINPAKALEINDNRKAAALDKLADNQESFKKAVNQINDALKKIPTSLDFQVDENSNRFVVNVADLNTGETIRQIPGDAVLRIARQLESLKGIIFDNKY